ncbi:dihydrofolate reductase family protein [Kineococcus sp. G2]|uniref:dihydrofolate reductase family protein n=1 Tax=Kineococcus sp. G2 TaxID=3127484 RepID=UPI00301C88C7
MRRLTYYVAVSLDGRIAGPGGDFSAFPVEGDHIETILTEWRDTLPAPALDALGLQADHRHFDSVLMGWNTYAAGFSHGLRDPYPQHEQIVFSRTRAPDEVAPGIRLTAEDPAAVVRRLKAAGGAGIWLCGGGRLATALADEIDHLVLKVNPLVLGEGPTLFAGPYQPRRFQHVASTPYRSGVVVTEYARR